MRTTRLLVLAVIVASGLVLYIARAQQAGIPCIDLQRHDLSLSGLEGAPLEYQVEGKPSVTLKPGDVLFIPAGAVYAAKNVGTENEFRGNRSIREGSCASSSLAADSVA